MMNNVLNKIKGHPQVVEGTAYAILFTMGTCHLLNDMIQSVIPAIYPLLKDKFDFTFAQIVGFCSQLPADSFVGSLDRLWFVRIPS